MIKRILSVLLLAWMAIAPAVANSCAAGCETSATASSHQGTGVGASSDSSDASDCHGGGATHESDESNMPDGGSMEVACLVASAASLPSASISLHKIEAVSEQHSAVLLPSLSFHTSAPARPPQA